MDAATLDRLLSDSLLMEASEGLDQVAAELAGLHESWASAGAARAPLNWLAGLIADLNWWSGRMLGGLSFACVEQEVPDNDAAQPYAKAVMWPKELADRSIERGAAGEADERRVIQRHELVVGCGVRGHGRPILGARVAGSRDDGIEWASARAAANLHDSLVENEPQSLASARHTLPSP